MTIINDFIFEKDVEVAAGAMNSGGLGGGSGFGGINGMSGGMNRSSGVMGNSGPAGLQYSIPGRIVVTEWPLEGVSYRAVQCLLDFVEHLHINIV